MSPRWRRAASTSVAPVDVDGEPVAVEELLLGLALVGAGHIGRRHREEVDRSLPPLVGGQSRARPRTAAATRDGPSRLTSTAVSRGESKLTAAAECTTMSHSESAWSPSVVEPEPVGGHVAGHRRDPRGDLGVEPVAVLGRGGGRSSRSSGSPWPPAASGSTGGPGRISRTTRLSGTVRSRRSTRAVPRKPVAPVMKNRLPARASRTRSPDLSTIW